MSRDCVSMTIDEISEVISDIHDKKMVSAILNTFISQELTYKVIPVWNQDVNKDAYRIYCYIKKSKESMIINTKTTDGRVMIQLRIVDRAILDHLKQYSDNIKKSFIDGINCLMPNCGNCLKWYTFSLDGKQYQKCHMLCNNFYFQHFDSVDDYDSMMSIVNQEILYGKPKRKVKQIR